MHVYVGYLVLLVTVIQTITGVLKYCLFKPGRVKSHNTIGLIVWMIGCANIFLAGCFWSSPFYGPGIMGLSALSVVGTVVTSLYIRSKSSGCHTPLVSVTGTCNSESYDRVPNCNENTDNRRTYTDL